MSNRIDAQYKELLDHILHFGVDKADRTGTGTKSIFGWQIRHNMKEGFPLLTTKKMAWKSIVTELLWFLRGDTNIKFLLDYDCHIWDGDAWANYSKKIIANNLHLMPASDLPKTKEEFINKIKTDNEFAKHWGDLGPIYGKQWRKWQGWIDAPNEHPLAKGSVWYDQIGMLIQQLKTNPDSRRLMVNAWNVGELDQMILPPCHYGFQVYTRELSVVERMEYYSKHYMKENETKSYDELLKVDYVGLNIPTRAISLIYNARSQDVPLGTPFNIASYALLLEIIAKTVNMVPDELISNMGDCHIYLNQIDGIKEQITRTPYELPKLVHMNTDAFYKSLSDDPSLFHHLEVGDFQIENYKSHPPIKIPLSN